MIRLLLLALCLAARPAAAASPLAVEAANGMVVSAHRLASAAGIEMLRQGGNAIDAAVAVGYALAVVDPCCGNIGGGGFLTAHLADGRDIFLNFREKAPASATADMYLDAAGKPVAGGSLYGWRAVGVPGTVMGLDTALARYGTLDRAIVMAPAIRLASAGFTLTRPDSDIIGFQAARLRQDPLLARIFLGQDGQALPPGAVLVQSDLAATLRAIAASGAEAFYHGAIPHAVAGEAQDHGGLLTQADFAAYTVTEAAPVRCAYRGYTVLSAAPPSSGGTALCEILNVLQGYDLRGMGYHSAAALHVMVEAMRHAYLDRNTYLGDPDFVTNPLARLLSADHATAIRAAIGPRATPSRDLGPGIAPHEPTQTTHYSVADAQGNAVAVTYTLNGGFGAVVMAPGTGFLLNNEMDDFTTAVGAPNLYGLVQGAANAIAPGKRPLSSMAPTIVLRDGKVVMVTGSPGGSRIITIVLETILNMVDFAMTPQEAVDAPRVHHQWLPDTVFAEPFAVSADTRAVLDGLGTNITQQGKWGAAEMIVVGPPALPAAKLAAGIDSALSGTMRPGLFYGASDSRRPAGAAIGF